MGEEVTVNSGPDCCDEDGCNIYPIPDATTTPPPTTPTTVDGKTQSKTFLNACLKYIN